MSQRKKSKEELFLQKLYELVAARGNLEQEIDRYEVGRLIGENTRSTDHTVQMLTKNGLIKKKEDPFIQLTPFGISFIQG